METLVNNTEMNAEQNNDQPFKTEFKAPESLDFTAMLNTPSETIKNDVPITTNTVAKNDEAAKPVDQETKSLDSITQNNQQMEQFYDEQNNKQWGLVDKVLNRGMYHTVQQNKKMLYNTTADYRLKFYKTILDARLITLQERVEAGVKMVKGHYRQLVSSFLMTKMSQLSQEVKEHQFNFINSMKDKYRYAATLNEFPSLKQKYSATIFQEEGRMLSFLDSLLIRFESIVTEELKKYN